MTNADKLLLLVLEACRPDQVEALLEISERKGQPLAELVAEMVQAGLDSEELF